MSIYDYLYTKISNNAANMGADQHDLRSDNMCNKIFNVGNLYELTNIVQDKWFIVNKI